MAIKLIVLCSILFLFSMGKEIILSKQNEKHLFKVNIGNLNMNLHPILSLKRTPTWIKSQDCKLCIPLGPEDKQTKNSKSIEKLNDKNYECSKSCFDKAQDQYGLKCIETHNKCKVLKEDIELQIGQRKMFGKLVQTKIQGQANHQKFNSFKTVLVQRIIDVPHKQSKTGKPENPSISSIGQYMIWGLNSLFQTNIVTKNGKSELVIYDGLKSNNLQKNLLPEVNPIQIEFQQTVTEFTLSQIKLSQKITINHQQKYIEDYEIPILPLQKGFISLETQNFILSKKHHQKLIDFVTNTYFSSQNNKCEFKDGKINCEKSIDLDKVEYLQLELILNGISIGFPFKALLKNCKGKSCDLRVQVGQNQSSFVLGTFFLEIFAVEFLEQTQNIKLYRLNNQWNQFYSKDQKYHKENFNIFWWIISSLFNAVFYILKIVFYLAIFSLVINFVYHWRKVIQWGGKIFDRIKKRKGRVQESGQLFENEEELESKDTAKLIRRFKNRRNKVFVEDQNQIVNDQITTQESN